MVNCFHCGDSCKRETVSFKGKTFCCHGCKTVFQILNDNGLNNYYKLENTPGTSPARIEKRFDYLDNTEIVEKLVQFNDDGKQSVSFLIPTIHCSSCIWVLENLNKLNPNIITSQVNFPKKTIRVTYKSDVFSLKKLVTLLANIGYEPHISLNNLNKNKQPKNRKLIYKLGVAGFTFGNIMFLSFPEYFEVSEFWLERFKHVFRWLMLVFSLPVVFYAASDYFISALKGLRTKMLNIDVPIAIGITVLFLRSVFEIINDTGTGFLDSLSGLVFFLLLGRFFQQKTYQYLSFERDYKSYFPIAITKILDDEEVQTPIRKLKKNDAILIRNGELIPVDGIITNGTAHIDYSFVTGESAPVIKTKGEKVYAGGKQTAGNIELVVLKAVEQSYLTQLWSNHTFKNKAKNNVNTITNKVSKHFTIALLSIAVISGGIWYFIMPSQMLNVFTAVLIVACPCAIALAAPFTLGNLLRAFGREKLYVKNAEVIEQMAKIDTIIFDKTGTLTTSKKYRAQYEGAPLSEEETVLLTSTLRASNHPLSRSLYTILQDNNIITLDNFHETIGYGIEGQKDDLSIKIGQQSFVTPYPENTKTTNNSTQVCIATNNNYKGCFSIHNEYRSEISKVFFELENHYNLFIVSGDNNFEQQQLEKRIPGKTKMYFNHKPEDKLRFVKQLQEEGKKVMMIGDGLNDAGALAQSDVGIAISEDVNVFSPACDAILDASKFGALLQFLELSKAGIRIITYAFIFSLFYNLIGLGFAVMGKLSPIVAAILMPLSSISIVIFTTIYANRAAYKVLKSNT